MITTNRRGHNPSSSSSSSSSSTSSVFTSPVLANSSFFSLDYFSPPNSSSSSTSTEQPIIRTNSHSRQVQIASFTDNPLLSFPSIHPFIYTSPTVPNLPTMTSTPGGSSVSGSGYHGIGLALLTASPGPSPSSTPTAEVACILDAPVSDSLVNITDTSSDPAPSADGPDGSKSRLAVHRATVQFPQPRVINYARPFRSQEPQQQDKVEPVPELPSHLTPTTLVPSSSSEVDNPPRPDYGAPPNSPNADASVLLLLPAQGLALLGSSTQRQRRLRHKSGSSSPASVSWAASSVTPSTASSSPSLASSSPTSTDSSAGPITPQESLEFEQGANIVRDVPTWTIISEGGGLGIDKIQQVSGVTRIEPVATDSEPGSEPEAEAETSFEEATPRAIDTRRQAVFDLTLLSENDQRRAVNEEDEATPKYRYRDSAFVATADILESYYSDDQGDMDQDHEAEEILDEEVSDAARRVIETTSSATSSVSGDLSDAFEFNSMLSISSVASLDSAAEVRVLRQKVGEIYEEECAARRTNVPVFSSPGSVISADIPVRSALVCKRPDEVTGDSVTSSRSVSGTGTGTRSRNVSINESTGNGSKIKRKPAPEIPRSESDPESKTESKPEIDADADADAEVEEPTEPQQAIVGVRATAQSVPTTHSGLPTSTSSTSISSISTSSSESQTQLRTPASSSASALSNPHASLSSTVSDPSEFPAVQEGQVEIKVLHLPREFHVNVPVPDSTPAGFGGTRRGEAGPSTSARGSGSTSGRPGRYMTRRVAKEVAEARAQEARERRGAGNTVRRAFQKMARAVS